MRAGGRAAAAVITRVSSSRRPMQDLDAELKWLGISTVLAGAPGMMTASPAVSIVSLARSLGASSRVLPLASVLANTLPLLIGLRVFTVAPKALFAALMCNNGAQAQLALLEPSAFQLSLLP